MKRFSYFAMMLAAGLVAVSCSEKIEVIKDTTLKLDFPAEATAQIGESIYAYSLQTDELTCSFDILSGAGDMDFLSAYRHQ